MARAKTFIVSYELYPFDVMVSTDSYEKVCAAIERKGYKLNQDEKRALEMPGMGRTCILAGGQTVLRLRREPICPDTIQYCAHEIFHAVDFLFDKIGIGLCDKSDEAYAYAIQFLTQRILSRFMSRKAKRRK